ERRLSSRPLIGAEGGSADSFVETFAEPGERFVGQPRERVELDRRKGEPGLPAGELGVRKEPVAEILVRKKLSQRSLHRLLSHSRPPSSRLPHGNHRANFDKHKIT